MSSGVACHLASAATGQATRGSTQDGHPAPRPPLRGSDHQWGGPCERSRALRDPEGARPQDPTGQLRGVLARVPREPGRSRGPGSRGPDAPRLPACARASSPAMAVTDGAPLHLSEPAAAASRTSSRPRAAQARRVSSDPAAGPSAPGPVRRQLPPGLWVEFGIVGGAERGKVRNEAASGGLGRDRNSAPPDVLAGAGAGWAAAGRLRRSWN